MKPASNGMKQHFINLTKSSKRKLHALNIKNKLKLNQINQMNISSEDKETLLKDIFMTICEYIKIHGLDETYKGHLDITRVTVNSFIDRSPYFNIKRQSLNIKDILSSRKNEKIEEKR